MLEVSATRALSRASLEYPPTDTKPIVPRIVSIVITTISSTRVKPREDQEKDSRGVIGVYLNIGGEFPFFN